MIERFNRSVKIKAAATFIGGVICLILTWLLFLALPGYVAWLLGYDWPLWGRHLVALALTGLLFMTGWRRAAAGGELQEYGDSAADSSSKPNVDDMRVRAGEGRGDKTILTFENLRTPHG